MSQQRFIVLLRFDSRRKKVCCFVGRYPNVPDLPFNRDLRRNWCRNPDGDQAPWCYTTDPTVRWEYCNLEKCPTKPSGTTRPQPQEPSTNTQTPAERGKSTFLKMWICQHFACQFFCQFFHFSWFSAAVLDCKTGNGETYRGPTSVTVLGVTCQAWSAQTPHEHSSFTPETHANKGLEGNVSVWVLLYKHFGERAELFVFFSSHLTLPLCPLSELQKPRR